jgi:hypothetical protein
MLWALTLVVAAPATAETAPPRPRHLGALEACRAIGADAARLACYDREAATLLSATRTGELSVVDRADMRSARRSLFGFSLPKLPFFSGDQSVDEEPNELATTIRSAQQIANGRYRITLADGTATWETIDTPMRLAAPSAGEPIVIKKGSLGAYFLRINGQTGVKGRRIK